ncbi:hypothetical protein TNCV_3037591 [Trichonephila clavipes]|nr:hypothetical protein TNCV_3037591 [Trichonephila clavipes]
MYPRGGSVTFRRQIHGISQGVEEEREGRAPRSRKDGGSQEVLPLQDALPCDNWMDAAYGMKFHSLRAPFSSFFDGFFFIPESSELAVRDLKPSFRTFLTSFPSRKC